MDDPTKFRLYTISSDINNSDNLMHNESKTSLIQSRKISFSRRETSCSIIRYTMLCCLSINYATVVRLPRELERHGFIFIFLYLTILLLIATPIVLLEMALGQFLGQASSNAWKISPFFKGAAIIGYIGALLGCIWITMQSSLIVIYIGQFLSSHVPLSQCPSSVYRNNVDLSYEERHMNGQTCLNSFIAKIYDFPINFLFLATSIVILWVIVMIITFNKRVIMRTIIVFGTLSFGLLIFQIAWQLNSIHNNESLWPQIWPINFTLITHSSTWFDALVQALLSTQIGTGSIPIILGKLVQKGDVLRMTVLYICFNLFISSIATIYFLMTFELYESKLPDLTTITSIYDRAFIESDVFRNLIPSLAYLMILLTSFISLSIIVYTISHLFRQKSRGLICLVIMLISILCLLYPTFYISQLMDFKWTGIFIICAVILENIAINWIYGTKSLSIDLEFSIGKPIQRFWLLLWAGIPFFLTGIFIFFMASAASLSFTDIVEKWLPFTLCICIFIYFAVHETMKQIDYNTLNKIREATHASKDFGPIDPLIRHAWKNWKSACNGTNCRDFTLRRRGTKDYTSSIKKGQYSHSKNLKSDIPQSVNCPKYMFENSVREEEDEKYSIGEYEQYFLHSFESIPIKVSNSSDQMQFTNKIYRNHDDDSYWNIQSLRQFSHMKHNSTFLKDSDEFSTEL